MEVWITYDLSLGFDTRAAKAYSTLEKAVEGIKAGYRGSPVVWENPIKSQDKTVVQYAIGEERRSWLITQYTVDEGGGMNKLPEDGTGLVRKRLEKTEIEASLIRAVEELRADGTLKRETDIIRLDGIAQREKTKWPQAAYINFPFLTREAGIIFFRFNIAENRFDQTSVSIGDSIETFETITVLVTDKDGR